MTQLPSSDQGADIPWEFRSHDEDMQEEILEEPEEAALHEEVDSWPLESATDGDAGDSDERERDIADVEPAALEDEVPEFGTTEPVDRDDPDVGTVLATQHYLPPDDLPPVSPDESE